jgi:hypothetical protein
MSMGFDDLIVGGQLRVGTGYCAPIKEGDYKINGSAHMEGPVVVGLGSKIKLGAKGGDPDDPEDNTGTAPANLMITRNYNKDKDCFSGAIKRTLQTEGNVRINGDDGTPNALVLNGNSNITGNDQTDQCIYINSSTSTAININGKTTIDNKGDAIFAIGTSGKTMSARFAESDGKPKPFDIQHPTKGNGHRLRYACIEGPEVGVYHRGRLRRGKEIVLPYYWKDLVHVESITIQLQPVGAHQDIIVKRWDNQKIYLQSNGGLPIDCFYHVYGERKDINPLITEYEGNDCFDYPDPNYKPGTLNPRYDDPAFSGPPNTITI